MKNKIKFILLLILILPFKINALAQREVFYSEIKKIFYSNKNLLIFFPIVFVIIAYLIRQKGEARKVISPQFYPPENLNSIDLAYIYKGFISQHDVVTLIMYLANKGYIKITNFQPETKSKKDYNFYGNRKNYVPFKLIKLKDYDGNNMAENFLMSKIFTEKNEVSDEELFFNSELRIAIYKIMEELNHKKNSEKIFRKTSLKNNVIFTLMQVLTFVFTSVNISSQSIGNDYYLVAVFLLPLWAFLTITFIKFPLLKKEINFKVTGIISSIGFYMFYLFFLVQNNLPLNYLSIIIGTICFFLISFFKNKIKRTSFGEDMFNKAKGFTKFLSVTESDKIEKLISENSNYYFEVLPYAYALGVSQKLIKKISNIGIVKPFWYESMSNFENADVFNKYNIYSIISLAIQK